MLGMLRGIHAAGRGLRAEFSLRVYRKSLHDMQCMFQATTVCEDCMAIDATTSARHLIRHTPVDLHGACILQSHQNRLKPEAL